MRTRFTLFVLLILASSSLQAQELYLRLQGSLTTPATSGIVEVSQITDSTGYTRQHNVVTTLGGGLLFGIDAGYQFSENFAAELGFQYLASNRILAKETIVPSLIIAAHTYTRMGQATLGIALNTGGTGLRGFTRMGALLPIFGATFIEAKFILSPPFTPSNTLSKTRNDGKFSIGWYGGMGVEYPLGDKIRISAEVSFNYLRVKTNTQTILERKDLNTGEDLTANLTTSEREIIYLDEINSNSNNRELNSGNFDIDKPEELLAYTSNYSNAGLRIGIAFSLFKK
ncbi:MAG TPA: hypothetical protein ENJ82_10945 [Bacteroidetes bacterium]|nr:hypothetical protein [Bacteroidota bacterium]